MAAVRASQPDHDRDHRRIHTALDDAYADAQRGRRELEPGGRYVIFSDQHRGARNGADDFESAEEAYTAALRWYFEHGYTLIVLGDAEELWQEPPAAVVRAYRECLALEAEFHRAGRYLRVWGNHDDDWAAPRAVRKHLQPVYGGAPLDTFESLAFAVRDGGRELGTLLLLHGHQGSFKSDRWSGVARWLVRHLYRPFQRLTGRSLDTPSKNTHLRQAQNEALYAWSAARERVVLIAGHTHRPVFESRSGRLELREQLAAARARLEREPDDKTLRAKVAELEAEVEEAPEADERPLKPCYFNTGCCCYPGGDITGIELAEGEIRLVHWPDEEGRMKPLVIERDALSRVFDAC
jgi:hypothetical protein